MDNFNNWIRSLQSEDFVVIHNGAVYTGFQQIFTPDNLTAQDAINLLVNSHGEPEVCTQYNVICNDENLNAAKAKLQL